MRDRFAVRLLPFWLSRKVEAGRAMAQAAEKRLPAFRFLVLVLALTLLLFAVIGALVTLYPQTNPAPETKKIVPQVRQLNRESLRQDDRNTGS